MSYPLIQQPAPLQQLAETLAAIRQARQQRIAFDDERRLAAARDARAEQYLRLNQQQQDVANQHWMAEQEVRKQELASMQANSAFNQQRLRDADRVANITRKRAEALARVRMGIPETLQAQVGIPQSLVDQVSLGDANKQLVGAPATPRTPVDVMGQVQQAQGRSRVGLTGSAVRAPTAGTSDLGVVFDPGAANINLPAGGGGAGRPPTTQDRLMRAAITGAYQQMESMERMESADPTSAEVPGVFAAIEGAGNIPVVGGALRGALEPAAQRALTPNQQSYQAMRREFIHTYASSLPGRRLGPELLKLLEVAFFPRAGQNDPGTLATYRQRRREAADRMYRAAQGEAIDLEAVLPANVRAQLEGMNQGAPSGVPETPAGPRINPRFMAPR